MRKIIGVLVLSLVASGFVMAQAAVTNNNCTIEWVQVDGKTNIRLTNNNDKAQSVQYTVGKDKAASIDVPAKTVVTIPYAGASANGAFSIAKVALAAKPKALPKDVKSEALSAAPTPAAGAAAAPATPAPAPAKK